MKIKANYALREVAGTWVVLPVAGETVNFNGMISLNETGALLWKVLEKDSDINSLSLALMQKYAVDSDAAVADAVAFVERLRNAGLIED